MRSRSVIQWAGRVPSALTPPSTFQALRRLAPPVGLQTYRQLPFSSTVSVRVASALDREDRTRGWGGGTARHSSSSVTAEPEEPEAGETGREIAAAGRSAEEDAYSEVARKLAQADDATLLKLLMTARRKYTLNIPLWKELTGLERATSYVELQDFCDLLQTLQMKGIRDMLLLGRMSVCIAPLIPFQPFKIALRVLDCYASWGALNGVLTRVVAAKALANMNADMPLTFDECVRLARNLSSLHARERHCLEVLVHHWKDQVITAPPTSAVQLLHSYAILDIAHDAIFDALRAPLLDGMDSLPLSDVSQIAYSILLSDKIHIEHALLLSSLHRLSECIMSTPLEYWEKKSSHATQRRVLLTRSALRYVHTEAYAQLPDMIRVALRKIHRLPPPPPRSEPTKFSKKLSVLLSKLRIAHFLKAQRGPLCFDVLERDRKVVWDCGTFDKYYDSTFDRTAPVKLENRIMIGMGYKVINLKYWQWGKLKAKTTRMEYIRMSRYYALRDRREADTGDVGWNLPAVQGASKFADSFHIDGYFYQNRPLSSVKY